MGNTIYLSFQSHLVKTCFAMSKLPQLVFRVSSLVLTWGCWGHLSIKHDKAKSTQTVSAVD